MQNVRARGNPFMICHNLHGVFVYRWKFAYPMDDPLPKEMGSGE